MPVLPAALQEKYTTTHGLSNYDAARICDDKEDAFLYESLAMATGNYKAVANWVTGAIKKYCNDNNCSIKDFPLPVSQIAELIKFTESGKVHYNIASTKLMLAMVDDAKASPENVAVSMNLLQENNTDALESWVNETLFSMPEKVKEYRSGKKGLIGLFAGQVKKLSRGKADMEAVTKMLEEKLAGG